MAGVTVKAERLLSSGRVRVLSAGLGSSTTRVVGDHGTYVVVRRRGGWSCSCPAWGGCSHLLAARLVLEPVVVPSVEGVRS